MTPTINRLGRLQWVETDGGQSKSRRPKEKRTCSIATVAIVMDWDYDKASKAFEDAGRKYGRGTPTRVTEKVLEGVIFKIPLEPKTTLLRFIKAHPRGRFVVRQRGHMFAIVNGVVCDWAAPKRSKHILGAYRVDRTGKPGGIVKA